MMTASKSFDDEIYPRDNPAKAEDIDGAIGELSPFHGEYGIYAHGVGPETATLPEGWQKRVIRVENENTGGAVGWCLDPNDLAYSKPVAARPKDMAFVRDLLTH